MNLTYISKMSTEEFIRKEAFLKRSRGLVGSLGKKYKSKSRLAEEGSNITVNIKG